LGVFERALDEPETGAGIRRQEGRSLGYVGIVRRGVKDHVQALIQYVCGDSIHEVERQATGVFNRHSRVDEPALKNVSISATPCWRAKVSPGYGRNQRR